MIQEKHVEWLQAKIEELDKLAEDHEDNSRFVVAGELRGRITGLGESLHKLIEYPPDPDPRAIMREIVDEFLTFAEGGLHHAPTLARCKAVVEATFRRAGVK